MSALGRGFVAVVPPDDVLDGIDASLAPLRAAHDGLRWTRQSLAEAWDCSERKVDRLRKSGVLGEPVGRIGRTDLYSNAQKQAAERAGLAGHQVEAEPQRVGSRA